MPFLPPNQQRQSTEGNSSLSILKQNLVDLHRRSHNWTNIYINYAWSTFSCAMLNKMIIVIAIEICAYYHYGELVALCATYLVAEFDYFSLICDISMPMSISQSHKLWIGTLINKLIKMIYLLLVTETCYRKFAFALSVWAVIVQVVGCMDN